MDYFSSVTLRGAGVSLVPLSMDHVADLAAGADEAIWRWMPSWHHLPGTMTDFVTAALELQKARRIVPFTTIDRRTRKVVGSTRFHYVEPEHRRLEIGVTWIATAFQRSHVNSEAKLLQLWYAFEIPKCRRVEWKTDAENLKSRAAIARLGAREEGCFRKHMIYPDGRNRDSVYFAITDDLWPTAKEALVARLGYPFEPSLTVEGRDGVSDTA
ncbi:GNAT family N-acetyltransferase [Chenggangzhangella methanolivorans]|uniref:GNAT family N-acetyltransferase n=1 Tax=Chenggangzhangella methanolivorans TaxID=1437009 RepID=A0A9E6UQ47_9HYPH|nr:GNAT family protein [Chenggangzhangella methanolivorans]QZO00500.1 GNAT family N-acetyltransferase [Chenggangzhangella methanolivorans]